MKSHREIELKLSLPHSGFTKVKRIPAIAATRQGRARTSNLISTYYDTPDLALSKAGISVRIRTEGRRHLQTVKTERSSAMGLFSRNEWEEPVCRPELDAALLGATGLAALADDKLIAGLVPVFSTNIRRTIMNLAAEDWRVEVALDSGTIALAEEFGAGAVTDIAEMELELKEGDPARLFALARDIVRHVPAARLESRAKSEQGFHMARKSHAAVTRAVPVALDAHMSIKDTFQAIAYASLRHFTANERALLASGDAEAIHQMRVGLRRLRSALKLFAPLVQSPDLAPIKDHIRWLLGALGPARDAEIFLSEIVSPVLGQWPDNPALADLSASSALRRDEAVAAARNAVDSRRFTETLLQLGLWLETGDWRRHQLDGGIAPYAQARLSKLSRKMIKAGGKNLSILSPEHLHEIRLLAKQFRYACEFFRPLYRGKSVKRLIRHLAELQDCLGVLNDISVAESRLAEYGTTTGPESAHAAGLIAGWHASRRSALVEQAERMWRRLSKEGGARSLKAKRS